MIRPIRDAHPKKKNKRNTAGMISETTEEEGEGIVRQTLPSFHSMTYGIGMTRMTNARKQKKKSYMLMLLQPNALPTELRRVSFT